MKLYKNPYLGNPRCVRHNGYGFKTYDEQLYCDKCTFSLPETNKKNGCKSCTNIRLCDEHFKLVHEHDKRCSLCDIEPGVNRGVCYRCTQKTAFQKMETQFGIIQCLREKLEKEITD